MNDLDFTESLIKGRIAETIFEMMFGHLEGFKLKHFGIEYTSPDLISKNIREENKVVIDKIGGTPDFLEIDKNNKVTLVEVKYRKNISPEYTLQIATKINHYWGEASLFLASPEGFYFDSITNIISSHGAIHPLSPDLIPTEIQQQYLGLLTKFNL